jgi:hypothetical protein
MVVRMDCTVDPYGLAAELNFSYAANQFRMDELIHTTQLNFRTDFSGPLCKNPYGFSVRFDLQKSAAVAKIDSVRCTADYSSFSLWTCPSIASSSQGA